MSYYHKTIERELEHVPSPKATRKRYDPIQGKYVYEEGTPGSSSAPLTIEDGSTYEHFVTNNVRRKKRPILISDDDVEGSRPPKRPRTDHGSKSQPQSNAPQRSAAPSNVYASQGHDKFNPIDFSSLTSVAQVLGSSSLAASRIKADSGEKRAWEQAEQAKRQKERAAQGKPAIAPRSTEQKLTPAQERAFERQTLEKFRQSQHAANVLPVEEVLASGTRLDKPIRGKSAAPKAPKLANRSSQSQALRGIVQSAKRNKALFTSSNEQFGQPSQRDTARREDSQFEQPLQDARSQQLDSQQGSTQLTASQLPDTLPTSSKESPSRSPPLPGSPLFTPGLPRATKPDADSPIFTPNSLQEHQSSEPRVTTVASTAQNPSSNRQVLPTFSFSQQSTAEIETSELSDAGKAESRSKCDKCFNTRRYCVCLDEGSRCTKYIRCDRCRTRGLICKPSDEATDRCKNCWIKDAPCIHTPVAERHRGGQRGRSRSAHPRPNRERTQATEIHLPPVRQPQPSTHAIPVAPIVERATEGQKCFSEAWRRAYLEELDAEEREGQEVDDEDGNGSFGSEDEQSTTRRSLDKEPTTHFVYRVFFKRWDAGQGMTEDDVEETLADETHTDLRAANEAVSRVATQNMTLCGKYSWEVDDEGMFTVLTTSGSDDEPGLAIRAWLQRDVRVSAPRTVQPESMRLPKKVYVVYEKVCLVREREGASVRDGLERRGTSSADAAFADDLEAQIEAALADDSTADAESVNGDGAAASSSFSSTASTMATTPQRPLTPATTIMGSETQEHTERHFTGDKDASGELVVSEKPVGKASYTTLELANRQASDHVLEKYVLAHPPRTRNLDQLDFWRSGRKQEALARVSELDAAGDAYSECLEGPRSLIPPGLGDEKTRVMVSIWIETMLVDGPRN